ncbi:MAG: NUDIX hydrolase [Candidatus Gracilibacteria bacterium]|nr:NUDIX hydrolase [Candidatus Gracilibacteria bacterium]
MTPYLSSEERFFVATKCCIYIDGKILVIREKKANGDAHWDLPGGKISKREMEADVISSLERELSEELGDSFGVREKAQLFHVQKAYEKAFHSDDILPFIFLCYTLELDEVPQIVLSDEHTTYRWIEESEIATLDSWRTHFDSIVKKAFESKNI